MEVTMNIFWQRLFIAVMVFALFFTLPFAAVAGTLTAKTLDRDADPVIITGARLPGFANAPLNQLFVYAYRGSQWQQIPWQFDEVRDLAYQATDNGTLDTADELVVMGRDCGDRAASKEWISDATSLSFPRYEITVVDPLNAAKLGWFYVYRSTTQTDTVKTDYVDYDFPGNVFTTPVYTLGFMIPYIGGDRLELNGSGIDVLDRSKYSFKPAGQGMFNEEWAEGEDPQPEILDGRVRAIAGYQDQGQGLLTFAYRSQFYDRITVDLSWAPVSLDWARASADFNENIIGGTYYDANTPDGVKVDGIPDSIAAAPAALWQQISASTGTILHAADVSLMKGTPILYYKDDATIDPNDTGDKKSYGDMGVTVTSPINYLYLAVTHYILPPNQPNIGTQYYAYFSNPLQVQSSYSAVEESNKLETPQSFTLSCAYPNPFNPATTMRYQAGERARVEIAIYNLSGRRIRTLVDEIKTPGEYEIEWDCRDEMDQQAASGIYFSVMQAGTFKMTRRLVLLR
jgi:hypothetical protein